MRTSTQRETIEFLKARAKGRIIGNGFWTPGAWFEWGSRKGAEIRVEKGTKVKDILADVRLAKKACAEGSYNIEYAR